MSQEVETANASSSVMAGSGNADHSPSDISMHHLSQQQQQSPPASPSSVEQKTKSDAPDSRRSLHLDLHSDEDDLKSRSSSYSVPESEKEVEMASPRLHGLSYRRSSAVKHAIFSPTFLPRDLQDRLPEITLDDSNSLSPDALATSPNENAENDVVQATLLKFGRHGKPHYRQFVLEPETLRWNSKHKNPEEAKVELKDVEAIVYGRNTEIFQKHSKGRQPGANEEHLSFSLVLRKNSRRRSIDVTCQSEQEFQEITRKIEQFTKNAKNKYIYRTRFSQ